VWPVHHRGSYLEGSGALGNGQATTRGQPVVLHFSPDDNSRTNPILCSLLLLALSTMTHIYTMTSSWGGGLNWYPRGTRSWRLTAEVNRVNHSSAQNILTGFQAGDSGTLFELQWLTDF
jgi:hypothetical protein